MKIYLKEILRLFKKGFLRLYEFTYPRLARLVEEGQIRIKGFSTKSLFRLFGYAMGLAVMVGIAGSGYAFYRVKKIMPNVMEMKNYTPSLITTVYDRNEQKVAEYFVEKRILLTLEEIPEMIKLATLAIEDDNFYNHRGIDIWGIGRAAVVNFKAGAVVQGGSTITQQVAKLLFLTRDRTFKRKIKEVFISLQMEKNFTKSEILEIYLNQIYYGHGAYGIEAASQLYFNKSIQDLTVSEMALLAGLPKAPNNFSPYKSMKKALARRNLVIGRMDELGFISSEEAFIAKFQSIELTRRKAKLNEAPFFSEHVRRYIEKEYGAKNLYHNGLNIYTTLNLSWQKNAQRALREGIESTDRRLGYRGPVGWIKPQSAEWISQQQGWDVDSDVWRASFDEPEDILAEGDMDGEDADTEQVKDEEENPYLDENNEIDWKKLNPYLSFTDEEEWFAPDRRIKAVVRGIEQEYILIEINGYVKLIDARGFSWAHTPKPKEDGRFFRKVKDALELPLKEGDIIEVRIVEDRDTGEKYVFLDQTPEVQGAIISMDYATGGVYSMVGGYDQKESSFNRAVQAKRQVGSAFKPIIYAAALDKGFTPASVIIDSPIIFEDDIGDFKNWKPVNYNEKFFGPTTLRQAVTYSRNIVTIKILEKIGIEYAIEYAKKLGIKSHMDANLSLALGASSVSLQEMTSVFSVFPSGGLYNEPYFIDRIEDAEGNIMEQHESKPDRVMSEESAYLISNILRSVVREGTATAVRSVGAPAGGKTGTTNDFLDAWFIGFTPGVACGVWIGKDREEMLGKNETGSRAASPIWLSYMKGVVKDAPLKPFIPPQNIVFMRIDKKTGALALPDNPDSTFESFRQTEIPVDYKPPRPIM